MTHPTTTTAELEENYDIHKIDYKQLLVKYKDAEEANDSFKLQLQDLNSRLNLEHKDKEQLRLELHKARNDMLNNPKGYLISPDADIEEVNLRLKEAYQKLEEEFELREKLNSDLEHTKSMLLAEGKVFLIIIIVVSLKLTLHTDTDALGEQEHCTRAGIEEYGFSKCWRWKYSHSGNSLHPSHPSLPSPLSFLPSFLPSFPSLPSPSLSSLPSPSLSSRTPRVKLIL